MSNALGDLWDDFLAGGIAEVLQSGNGDEQVSPVAQGQNQPAVYTSGQPTPTTLPLTGWGVVDNNQNMIVGVALAMAGISGLVLLVKALK